MKKLILFITIFAMTGFVQVFSQVAFGVSAGLHSLSIKIEEKDDYPGYGDSEDTVNESGFYIGVFAEFELSDKVDLRPALYYNEIEDYGTLLIPLMAKFNVADQFYLQGGP